MGAGRQPCARKPLGRARIPKDGSGGLRSEGKTPGIVSVAYRERGTILMSVDEALVRDILLHRGITVHMIRHDAGKDRDTRLKDAFPAKIGKLPGRQLEDYRSFGG